MDMPLKLYKKLAEMLKGYGIYVDHPPLKEYALYTRFGVDNYGWSLNRLSNNTICLTRQEGIHIY